MVAGGEETNHCENCQAGAHCGPDDHSSVERSLQQCVTRQHVLEKNYKWRKMMFDPDYDDVGDGDESDEEIITNSAKMTLDHDCDGGDSDGVDSQQ